MLGLRIERLRKSSLQYVAAILGFVLKTLAIGLSCSIAETHFFNSSAEIMGLLAWSLAFSYVLSLRVFRAHSLGAISLPPVALLLAVSLFRATESPDPGVSSGWLLASHILSAFLGYGLF